MSKSILALLAAALLFCNFQCGEDPDINPVFSFELDVPFEMMPDASYQLKSSGTLIIGFNRIISDNRCPKDVFCALAGSADAELLFYDNNTSLKDTLASLPYGMLRDSTTFSDFSIKLTKVAPEQESGKSIQPSDYRLTMLVSKK